MTGWALIIAFVVAIVLMILLISKLKVHPFLAIMGISLLLAILAGIKLTDIPGIGPKTAHDLLLRFGSVKQIQLQTLADLVDAIGPAKAQTLYNHLHSINV